MVHRWACCSPEGFSDDASEVGLLLGRCFTLTDATTELDHGPAHARAVPVDDGWLITLIGSYSTYYTYDHTTVFKGRSAITSDRADGGAAPTDQVLLDSVDDPEVWVQQYELAGDIDSFALALYTAEAKASTHDLTFTRAPRGDD